MVGRPATLHFGKRLMRADARFFSWWGVTQDKKKKKKVKLPEVKQGECEWPIGLARCCFVVGFDTS